ncbi:vacuolar protein sorting-associated protein 37D [Astyanax mexicanus]|uniref:Vacuolar protein sorting-associated protein 37D-like n=2 Tax=Astyanax mexicanus TaxID=7994 RepID=A0A8B9HLZ4_ASTMX|nr:vacuolar protein sorting-associated protein 37D [Astyanax mexicanus]KAG9282029.1 vacuolar protein sorting-associated protein 37D-like [Astyanax mexicanus]
MSQKQREANSCPDGYRVLNTSELRELLQDEEKMDQIVRLNEKFQELQVDRETLLVTNRSLAEESLAHRPRLQNGKLQLATKYQELAKLTTACREKQSRLEGHMKKHSPQTAQNLLQEEVARAEEQSEELLERFMEGQVPLEGFLDSFQSFRKTYHIRRAQAEKIQELNRPERKQRKRLEEEEVRKKEEVPKEPRPNGITAHGPPRVFQLRYGLTPAILVPLNSSSAVTSSASLSPLDSCSGPPQASGPSAPHSCPGQPVGLRVIGQLPGWPTRPVRLQQLYRPSPHQHEPPYR